MISFLNDYSEGACQEIMRELIRTNWEDSVGYGLDEYSKEAKRRIKETIGEVEGHELEIHFLVGGTQANLAVISYLLKPSDAVISCVSGHINTHETGSIEATGHKVIPTIAKDGKIQISEIERVLKEHLNEHMVKPAMVYISNSTEIGSVYTKDELIALSEYCKAHDLLLFMDGARLGAALTSHVNDLSLNDIARLTDVFYIGGTKNGALFGEAVVFKDAELSKMFRYQIKQRGGMLAKGRLLGIQFNELFKNELYFKLARHENELAQSLQAALIDLNIELMTVSTTNQIFPIISKDLKEYLEEDFAFEIWEEIDEEHIIIRLVTSWASKLEEVNALINKISEYINRA